MSLKKKALSGFFWSSAGTMGNGLVNLTVTMILARILSPTDFALIALLSIFSTASEVIVDSGFSQAIIRDDNPSPKDLSSVFFFNLVLSIILYAILYCVSPSIAKFYDAPELAQYSRVVFLVIIFNASTLIQSATLKRNLDFPTVEKSMVLGSVTAGIIAVVMALTGCGIWSLVANIVLMPLGRSIFLWFSSKWRPILTFSLGSIKKYFKFGIFLATNSLVDVIVMNLNSLLIGKVYTKNDLGYYSQALKLDTYFATPIRSILNKVIYPITSKVKDNQTKLREAYGLMAGMLLFVSTPLLLFIYFNADSTIVFFFGEKWRDAGVYLRLLALLELGQMLQNVFNNCILVTGKTNALLVATIIKQGLRLLAIFCTINISVYAMILGYTISGILGSLIYSAMGMYFVKYNPLTLIKDNYKSLLATAVSLGAIFILRNLCDSMNEIMLFMLQIALMTVSYILASIVLKNKYLTEIAVAIKSLKSR